MYIKVTTNNAGQAYYHLVESYRDNGRVRQRTLLSLGRVEEGKLDDLARALGKHREGITALDLAKDISIEETFILGPLLILQRLFERLGIRGCLEKIQFQHPQLELNLQKIVFTLVASRFVKPSSKLAVYDRLLEKFYPEMVDHDLPLHVFYRALDILQKHKEELEGDLFWHGRDLFTAPVDVVLYDLTTLRFESIREDGGKLRRFGYSKERRSDCTQVILGLLIGTDGIPLGFELYPGNTFEGKTLSGMVEKLKSKFKIRRLIFVADRGLLSRNNLVHLRKDEGEFIVGMKLSIIKDRQGEIYHRNRFRWINEGLAVYETTHEGDRLIITWSKARAERDQKAREDILNKIRKKLSGKISAKKFVSHRAYQRYLLGLNTGNPRLNEKAIQEDQARDGFFGVLTNVKTLAASEVITNYKQLWKIEYAFGEIKGTLKARPIFHWTDQRIIGHLVICFLSYLCEAHMTKELRERALLLQAKSIEKEIIKPRSLTAAMAMEDVAQIRAIPVQLPSNQKLWVRTDIKGLAADLFKALGVAIPPKVLHFKNNQTDKNVVAQGTGASVTDQ